MRRSRVLVNPVATIEIAKRLECGGKRCATPLWLLVNRDGQPPSSCAPLVFSQSAVAAFGFAGALHKAQPPSHRQGNANLWPTAGESATRFAWATTPRRRWSCFQGAAKRWSRPSRRIRGDRA